MTCLETSYTGSERSIFSSLLKLSLISFVIYYTPGIPSQQTRTYTNHGRCLTTTKIRNSNSSLFLEPKNKYGTQCH